MSLMFMYSVLMIIISFNFLFFSVEVELLSITVEMNKLEDSILCPLSAAMNMLEV